MAFNRVVELNVGTGGRGLQVSGLNITFDIERSVKAELNTANFTVYNASVDTRSTLLSEGNNIIFKAGYADESGAVTIFNGTISNSVSYKSDADWITEIEAVDIGANDKRFETSVLSLSYAANTPMSSVLNDVSSALNVLIAGVENVSDITLTNGIVIADNANNVMRQLLRILETYDIGLFFDSNEMVVYKKGVSVSTFSVTKVTPRAGLIGTVQDITDATNPDDQKKAGDDAVQTKKRLKFTSLLNAKLRPASTVQIVSQNATGAFTIEKSHFFGDNFGGDFLVECEVVE